MNKFWIDLRSDTFTLPTSEMKEAMFSAAVGDDVFGEDPSINELENYCAALFGMEAAMFCSSGTQTNQIGIRMHTRPGDEVICHELSHVYLYEGGGIASNSGCSVKLISGNFGVFNAAQAAACINKDDVHFPNTRLICVENTVNRGGGSCWEISRLEELSALCVERGLAFHLDGARLFNAMIAKNESPIQYGKLFNSISICLSKGLGAPVGSILLGKKEDIKRARRIRKVMGGGMRQAGFLAAAGLYALKHHVDRLSIDHERARLISNQLKQYDWVEEIMPVETNIIIARLSKKKDIQDLCTELAAKGVGISNIGNNSFRMVFHLNQQNQDIERLQQILNDVN